MLRCVLTPPLPRHGVPRSRLRMIGRISQTDVASRDQRIHAPRVSRVSSPTQTFLEPSQSRVLILSSWSCSATAWPKAKRMTPEDLVAAASEWPGSGCSTGAQGGT